MLIDAIRERPCHLRRKVAIAHRPLRRGVPEERQILLDVEANRIVVVVAGTQPSVARAFVVFDAAGLVGAIRVRMTATLKIRCESVGPVERAVGGGVAQALLSSFGAFDPAKHVIERPVLHHQHDDVFDAGRFRRR